ncbi:MAG: HlyC/CorC family transporter [Thaumarchaeota archaeon]|nr:HlyC/CorC family transporter [Nitrososphaerota archaeon]
MVDIVQIVVLVTLIGLSAFFSASETAVISTTEVKVRTLIEERKKGANALYKLKQNPKRFLITILIGNNLVNIGAAALGTLIATEAFGSVGLGIATGVLTLAILTFGEITPKSYATVHNEKISLLVARPIELLSYILVPLVIPFEKLTSAFTKSGIGQIPLVTEEELKTMIEMSAEQQVIEKHEMEFIKGALKSGDITAREVMTPRVRMFVLDSKISVKDAMNELVKSRYSRAPIIDGSRDKVVGIAYLKELLTAHRNRKGKLNIMEVARTPLFVSQTEAVGNLLREFQSKKAHMAIVVDEFGGVEGLLTLEDLVEEIVGEIVDEGEISPMLIRRIDRDTILVHGDTEIEDVERFLNVDLSRVAGSSTINGLLHHVLKDLPKIGDEAEVNNVLFYVEEVKDNAAVKVRIKKK